MIKKTFKFLLGIISIIIGLTALLIPILPTSPFLLFGLVLISPKLKDKLLKLKDKFKRNRG